MKKLFFIFLWLLINSRLVLADWGILWDFKWDDAKTEEALRTWDIHIDDIPNILTWSINFFLWIAGTISIIFIIIWAYQILFWSLTQDPAKWKNTIIMAIVWFVIATLSWFIIKLIIDNFSW